MSENADLHQLDVLVGVEAGVAQGQAQEDVLGRADDVADLLAPEVGDRA